MLPKRILLAEDDPLGVELTLAALEQDGLADSVEVVNDGEQTMEYLQRQGDYAERPEGNPDVILLDLKMPRMDGLQVLRAMRDNNRLALIPVVVMTSSRMDSDRLECYRNGANAYVVKPVDYQEFTEAVHLLGKFWGGMNEPPPVTPA